MNARQKEMMDSQVFGTSERDVEREFDRLLKSNFGNIRATLLSCLSDVQELIERGQMEMARKGINRVKHNIIRHVPKEK